MKNQEIKKKEVVNLESLGKVPPHDIEVEKVILGAMLIDPDAVLEVMSVITPESFYHPEHQTIYKAILNLAGRLQPIDLITVSRELKDMNKLQDVGSELYLSELTDRVGTSAHLDFHAKILQQQFIARELIKIGAIIQKRAFDGSEDVQDLIEYAEGQVFGISNSGTKKEVKNISTLVGEVLEKLEKRSIEKKNIIGIPSGFTSIDRITAGFQAPDLIILAARPSMGKTAFALNLCRNIAIDFRVPAAIFSLEMSEHQLTDRLIISESGIDGDNYKSGRLTESDWEKIEKASGTLQVGQIYIDDTPSISVWELRSKARKLVRQGVGFIAVDYLQLMTAGKEYSGNREGEVSMISRTLKAIAKELNVPILALSQLNRSVEARGDKRPQLSDLRESGAIEQDADMVIFIHRPEYYGIKEVDGESTERLAEIIIAKYRNGTTGKIKLNFDKTIVKFSDYYSDKIEASIMRIENNFDIPTNTEFYQQEPPF